MMEWLERLFQSLSGPAGYGFLFLSSYVENLFPPAPGDTFTVIGAVLAGRGQLSFFWAYLSTLLGSVAGFMTCYAIGRRWGREWFRGKRGRVFSGEHLERVERWFKRYGLWVLVFNRFLSGFRSVVSFAAGMARMDAWKVFLLALFSCAVWNGLLMGLGVWAGGHWAGIVRNYERIILGAIAGLLIFWWARSVLRKRQ